MAQTPKPELEIRLTDTKGKVYYTEPIRIWRGFGMHHELDASIDSFRQGASDALNDIERDFKADEQLKDVDTGTLIRALNRRGYKTIAS